MAHHGSDAFDQEFFKKFNDSFFKSNLEDLSKKSIPPIEQIAMGATGKYPEGKLTNNDEGELMFGIAIYEGKLILNFGKPVEWIGMTKKQAKDLAEHILNKIKEF